MTALADISKAAAAMYGDRLRGSDLAEFNEQHKRDAQGRFAALEARKARRQRRGRAAIQFAQSAQAEAPQAEARTRNTSLAGLRARTRPQERQARHRTMAAAREQAIASEEVAAQEEAPKPSTDHPHSLKPCALTYPEDCAMPGKHYNVMTGEPIQRFDKDAMHEWLRLTKQQKKAKYGWDDDEYLEAWSSHVGVDKSLTGAALAEFNEERSRDDKGRFAAVAAAPAQTDPRAARKARVKRRVRRAVRAVQARANVAAVEAKQAEEQKSDLGSLQSLRRPRTRTQQQAQAQVRTRTRGQVAPEKSKGIADESYMAMKSKKMQMFPTDSVVIVTMAEANELLRTGKLVVGAANAHWNTKLFSMQTNKATVPNTADLSGFAALRLINPHFVDINDKGETDGTLSAAQRIVPWGADEGRANFTGYLGFDKQSGKQTDDPSRIGPQMRMINVNAYSDQEWDWWGGKADETWDEDEHKRDPRSGRFTARAAQAVAATPTVLERDPRVSREQRARRRRRRAIRAHPAQGSVAPAEVEDIRERAAQHRTAMRADPRARSASVRRPIPAARPKSEPKAEPESAGKPEAKPKATPDRRRPGPDIAPNFDPMFPLEGEYALDFGRKGRAPAHVVRDPRARTPMLEFTEDLDRVWIDPETGYPRFKPGMKASQVPTRYRENFKMWERAQARKGLRPPS